MSATLVAFCAIGLLLVVALAAVGAFIVASIAQTITPAPAPMWGARIRAERARARGMSGYPEGADRL